MSADKKQQRRGFLHVLLFIWGCVLFGFIIGVLFCGILQNAKEIGDETDIYHRPTAMEEMSWHSKGHIVWWLQEEDWRIIDEQGKKHSVEEWMDLMTKKKL